MKVVRIIFLVVANIFFGLLYVSASAYAPLQGDHFTASTSFNPFDDSFFSTEKPVQSGALVPFVPVTAYTHFAITDITDVSRPIYVSEKWYEEIAALPVWENNGVTLTSIEESKLASFLNSPSNDVYIVPVSFLKPTLRVLNINSLSYLNLDDTNEWPVIVSLPRDDNAAVITVNDEIYEVSFAGTVVLSRGVAERIRKYNDPFYPWQQVADLIQQADIHIHNFKGSITSDCEYDGYTLKFCGVPSYLAGMKKAGVDGVSVSGNHIGDYGQSGMEETLQYLDEYEIAHTGLDSGIKKAAEPLVYSFGKGESAFTIAMAAFNNVFGTAPCANDTPQYGVTCLLHTDALTNEITQLKKKYDFVVAYHNWGPEYTHYPDKEAQIDWGRAMVEAGADLVIGDQAHWVQTMEFYQNTPIYYGLGNFVFDQMWSEKTREGLYLRVYFNNGKVLSIEPVPIKIYDYTQPRVETGASGRAILQYLALPLKEE
ncbi:CapA family protein [candidate division WWE3 bacterium]|uniref:CapA family protein n=1 Tax=candidate division WWE3 bacterium TaxID=2053526 RepID=A0A955LVD9_UNCKA|nr:CapA family protein [candidate division WWE3 bacterium]